jgi:hypothetical protein
MRVNLVSSGQQYGMMGPSWSRRCWAIIIPAPGLSGYELFAGLLLKKRHDPRTGIEAVLVQAPRLQCAARHVKHLRRLTLGDALGVQVAVPLT